MPGKETGKETIGRELYSAPPIWVPYNPEVYESYSVAEIGYDENREINRLAIANKAGAIIYRYGDAKAKAAPVKTEPAPDDAVTPAPEKQFTPAKEKAWSATGAISAWCHRVGLKMEDFGNMRSALIAGGIVPEIKSADMTPNDVDNLCNAIQQNFPDMLRTTA